MSTELVQPLLFSIAAFPLCLQRGPTLPPSQSCP